VFAPEDLAFRSSYGLWLGCRYGNGSKSCSHVVVLRAAARAGHRGASRPIRGERCAYCDTGCTKSQGVSQKILVEMPEKTESGTKVVNSAKRVLS
jgi:hypothetical protein